MDTLENPGSQNFTITTNWDTHAKSIREQYPLLTETDMRFETGKENELLSRMETRLNKKREEVIGIIKNKQGTNQ